MPDSSSSKWWWWGCQSGRTGLWASLGLIAWWEEPLSICMVCLSTRKMRSRLLSFTRIRQSWEECFRKVMRGHFRRMLKLGEHMLECCLIKYAGLENRLNLKIWSPWLTQKEYFRLCWTQRTLRTKQTRRHIPILSQCQKWMMTRSKMAR